MDGGINEWMNETFTYPRNKKQTIKKNGKMHNGVYMDQILANNCIKWMRMCLYQFGFRKRCFWFYI